MSQEFPRMVYRDEEHRTVHNGDELAASLKEGFVTYDDWVAKPVKKAAPKARTKAE